MNYLGIAKQLVKVEEMIIDAYSREHSARGLPSFLEPMSPEIQKMEEFKKFLLDEIVKYHTYEQTVKERSNEKVKQ